MYDEFGFNIDQKITSNIENNANLIFSEIDPANIDPHPEDILTMY